MPINVKFAKVRPNAKIPSKRDEDMGFDIYACFEQDYICIPAHETKLIPTGIASSCENGYGFVLRERGSTGSKGIALRAGVIDSGYRNEWFVGLTNTTNATLYISKLSKEEMKQRYIDNFMHGLLNEDERKRFEGMLSLEFDTCIFYPYNKAIAQALVLPVPKVTIEEMAYEELQQIASERGLGALGSSGK